MTIRRAVIGDLGAIVVMACQFIQTTAYAALIGTNPAQLGRLAAYLMNEGVVLVAEVDGALIGMLAAQTFPHPMSGELTGTEAAWWVDPGHRGGGAALRLLAAAEKWAREQGAVRFQMIAPAASGLGELYKRRGYVEVETVYQRPLAA